MGAIADLNMRIYLLKKWNAYRQGEVVCVKQIPEVSGS